MVLTQTINENYKKTYSDQGFFIRQLHTGNLYVSALDRMTNNYQYEETNIPIPEKEKTNINYERIIDILSGEGE